MGMQNGNVKAALAIGAAIVGAGFASGREVAAFFAVFGAASWLGVVAACAGVGYLTYLLTRIACHTGRSGLAAQYDVLMGAECGSTMRMLYGVLALCTAAAMTAAGGEVGALALPWRHARLVGTLGTLLVGMWMARRGVGALASIGALLTPLCALYYLFLPGEGGAIPPFRLSDVPMSLALGLLYAAFNASLASGAICLTCRENISPARAGAYTSIVLAAMLVPANAALLRAGADVYSMAMPSVMLAARWGVGGFYASCIVLFLAVLSTLSAMLCSLERQIPRGVPAYLRYPLCALGALGLSVCGFETIVNAVYPILGWLCALALLALTLFVPERTKTTCQKTENMF